MKTLPKFMKSSKKIQKYIYLWNTAKMENFLTK